MIQFSIVIPIYNVQSYLDECIQSVLSQEYQNYEILLINDGSTDNSKSICERYEKKHNKIKYFYKKNGGLSDARNFGIQQAIGEYIVFLDSDDMLYENTLKMLDKYISKYKYPELIIQNYVEMNNLTKDIVGSKFKLKTSKKLFEYPNVLYNKLIHDKGYLPTAWNIVVRREKFIQDERLNFHKGILHEDEEWSPRIILSSKNILFIDNNHYIYRTNRNDSIMGTKSEKSILDRFIIIDRLMSFAKEKDYMVLRLVKIRISQLYAGIGMDFITYKNLRKNSDIIRKMYKYKRLLFYSMNIKHWIFYFYLLLICLISTDRT